MAVKPEETAKPKTPVKHKTKAAIQPKDNRNSKKNDFAHFPEDILSNVGVGIYIVQQGKFVYVSSLYEKLSGYSDQELIQQRSLDYIHPDDRDETRKNAIKALKRERSDPYEYRFIKKNHDVMWVLEMVTSVTYKGKQAALGSFMDITERKQIENALFQSEEKYRTILENIEDGYAEIDLHGNFIFFNEALCKTQGHTKDELMKLNYRQLMDETNANKIFQYYHKVYKTGQSEKNVEYEVITKDGSKRAVETSITPIRDAAGRIIAFRGILRDRTERRQAEESLRQSEERYRRILEEMDNAYFEVDLVGNYTFVNDATSRLLGYSKEELIGKTFREQVNKEDTKILYQAFGNIFNTGKPERGISYKAYRKDGKFRFAEIAGFPIHNQEGEIIGFRGIGRDVTERKIMEETLRQSEERYRTILEEMDNAYFEVDLTGNFTFVNDAISRLLGYSKQELIGKTFREQMNKESTNVLYQAFGNIFNTGKPERGISYRAHSKDGKYGYAEVSGFPIHNPAGEIIGFRGIGRDVTERKLMEEALRQSEERYRTVMEEMDEWYFESDLAGNILFVNDATLRALDYLPQEFTGSNFRSFFRQKDSDAIYEKFHVVYETGKPVKNFPMEITKPDGSIIFAEISILPKHNEDGKIYEFRGVGHDITERKRANEQIQYLATHDGLTGLPNRILFSQLLNHAIQSAQRYKRVFALFFIDLDRFKVINDTLGHDAGDQLLQEISIRFKQALRSVDIVARLGGDEFVVLMEEIGDFNYVTTVAQKILSATIKPMTILKQECRVTASIGISLYPKDGEDEQSLMKNADIAMYFAKEEGKNNYQFYSTDIKSQSIERLSLETKLRLALESNELSLQYQAKLDVMTGEITGMEALLRWNNPDLGSISPTQFIPVAEEIGMIVPIGRWVLQTACAQNVAWQRQGLPSLCMAVNLSVRQLSDDHLIDDIEKALEDSGMNPNLLELEITESMVMHNPVRMIPVLNRIKDLGVRLAIDDFGTGYSSLSQIRNFQVDSLKIDRSFMHNIMKNAEDKAITKAIISMGKTLSLTIIAEGVETEDQMIFLQQHSCDEMQGFHFSKPIDPDKFAYLLKNHLPFPIKSD